MTDAHPVTVIGEGGAYIEYVVPAELLGGGTDRVQIQVLIPDKQTGFLWGVTCDVPPEYARELKPKCAEIAGTFIPLPEFDPNAG